MALHFSRWLIIYSSSSESPSKHVLFTGATGLWMLLTAESYVLHHRLEPESEGGERNPPHSEYCPSLCSSPSPHCFCVESRWTSEAGHLFRSSQLPAQVKSKGGGLLGTTALPEWLGFNLLDVWVPTKSQILRILPRLCDHAKSADRKYSLSKFLFYVTFNYKTQTLQKNECLITPFFICYF